MNTFYVSDRNFQLHNSVLFNFILINILNIMIDTTGVNINNLFANFTRNTKDA